MYLSYLFRQVFAKYNPSYKDGIQNKSDVIQSDQIKLKENQKSQF